ncbi:cGMP-dependent protein kinase 1-like isoform X2 [Rhynchophorus ferrugineus]|uniref:cGMP-dependent protein kinase 1-like isoform X2 n=1 Tax=Rhynchophorus ferrugineus TaxID=354439 RepID=UPI003FCD4328
MRCWRPVSKKYIVSKRSSSKLKKTEVRSSLRVSKAKSDKRQSGAPKVNGADIPSKTEAVSQTTAPPVVNANPEPKQPILDDVSTSKSNKTETGPSSRSSKTKPVKKKAAAPKVNGTDIPSKTEAVSQTTTTEQTVVVSPVIPANSERKQTILDDVSSSKLKHSGVLKVNGTDITNNTEIVSHTATPSVIPASPEPKPLILDGATSKITNDKEADSIAASNTIEDTTSKADIVKTTVLQVSQTSKTRQSSTLETSRISETVVDPVKVTETKEIEQSRASMQLLSVTSPERNVSVSSLHSLADDRKTSVASVSSDGHPVSQSDRRRSGVQVGTPVTLADTLPVYEKSEEDQNKIKQAIQNNEFLSKVISGKCLNDIINAMQVRKVQAKQKIIKQDDKGSEMYVSMRGKFRILKKGKVVGEFNDIRVFGELAILYKSKRLATIQAVTDGAVWVLGRDIYQQIVISSNLKEQDENLAFLKNVDYLNVVNEQVLRQVSNLLKPEFFPPSTTIVRQGDKGDKFYIIRAGTVTITKTGAGVLGKLGKGQCFGEMALQKEDTRQATVTAEAPGVDCLTLTRADFINHFGDVEIPKIEVKKTTFKDDAEAEYQDIKLTDLKILTTLGIGGFGRVELVQHKKKKNLVFSLKYLKKAEIVHMKQENHVYNEKIIQMNCKSHFIVRLYRTYKDNKYVYFLMEACLGGDLFSLIQKQKGKRFEEKDAKFYVACVIESLDYLHSKGIIYRDLKPENLMVDKIGYLKLTDFGFAKRMPARGKTFTFAGTPEYVAPEIVLNRGHDRSVDYWALGVFVFELLTGKTPFKTGDTSHMRTYNKILNGIINFPPSVSPKARNLVEKLCRPGPAERLGMQKGGIRDIKMHKWYQDFDWIKFGERQISAPIKPKIRDALDTSNFDRFPQDKNIPPDETSGWDIDF